MFSTYDSVKKGAAVGLSLGFLTMGAYLVSEYHESQKDTSLVLGICFLIIGSVGTVVSGAKLCSQLGIFRKPNENLEEGKSLLESSHNQKYFPPPN